MAGIIKRGDIWLINLEPSFGREIHKKRPALIISKNSLHKKTSHAIVVPASSQIPQLIGIEMVLIGKEEGLNKSSILLSVFIRSVDQKRLVKKIGKISSAKLREVEEAIRVVLDLNDEDN